MFERRQMHSQQNAREGQLILIGLTYVESGAIERQEQKYGVVEDISEGGISVRLSGGEIYWLPPDLRSIGEVVVEPDFITNWRLTPGKWD